MQQRTIAKTVSLTGVGLHSGKPVTLTFLPALADSGIVFYRSDMPNPMPISADFRVVKDTQMSSNLSNEQGHRIGTVEHLMSALAALGIDNLAIEVSAAEIPIMDGSALPFIDALRAGGIVQLSRQKKFIEILRPITVSHEDKIARFTPYQGFALAFDIEFDHPAFLPEHNHITLEFSTKNFINEISQARTFGFQKDIEYLKQHNLGMGGSLDNAIVLDETKVLNPDGLRFADEFVRHKVLDAVGDLYLAGHQILGKFYAKKSGHMLNNRLLRAIFEDDGNYRIVTNYDNNNPLIDYNY